MSVTLPFKHIHIIGIGGIGMSALAEWLVHLGYRVQGSDQYLTVRTTALQAKGITIYKSHESAFITPLVDLVVTSTAIPETNVEIRTAKALLLPVWNRAMLLAELTKHFRTIAISGAHGKTSTTALLGTLFSEVYAPTIIAGGIMHAYHSNVVMGKDPWCIVEADESDNTFTQIHYESAILTNIDREHVQYYGNFETLLLAYERFLTRIPSHGKGVVCLDSLPIYTLYPSLPNAPYTYSTKLPQADVYASSIKIEGTNSLVTVCTSSRMGNKTYEDILMPVLGIPAVQNALAAITMALLYGIDITPIRKAIKHYQGVDRRFTQRGIFEGMTIIDDYAHHPAEIEATLQRARQAYPKGRLFLIFQPHRYSRLSDLWNAYLTVVQQADYLFITEVYSAGEDPIEGIDSNHFKAALQAGHAPITAHLIEEVDTLAKALYKAGRAGDCILFVGAGNITQWAKQLAQYDKVL